MNNGIEGCTSFACNGDELGLFTARCVVDGDEELYLCEDCMNERMIKNKCTGCGVFVDSSPAVECNRASIRMCGLCFDYDEFYSKMFPFGLKKVHKNKYKKLASEGDWYDIEKWILSLEETNCERTVQLKKIEEVLKQMVKGPQKERRAKKRRIEKEKKQVKEYMLKNIRKHMPSISEEDAKNYVETFGGRGPNKVYDNALEFLKFLRW